jgi:NAD(P)-dependent dehydrogenase (short-subunit alcohol dehydrogenase family)
MSDQSVLIVGATGGLGPDVVRAFMATELNVHFTGRRSEVVAEMEKEIPNSVGHTVDPIEESAIRGVIEQIDDKTPLAAYVHLAGAYACGPHIDELSPEDWQKMLDSNWRTLMHGASAAFGVMRRRESGSIVTIGSLAGLNGGVANAPYAVSKAAVISFTRCLAEEGKRYGVRANCIVPGILNTPANRKAMPDGKCETWTPTEDVAKTIVFLCGVDSLGVNGSTLLMKGGL